jgi:hypothetical protein
MTMKNYRYFVFFNCFDEAKKNITAMEKKKILKFISQNVAKHQSQLL